MSDPVTLYGDAVLKAVAPEVEDFSIFPELARRMYATMEQKGGVGIAAPQIGVSVRAFIVASRPNARYPDAPVMEPTLMINPQILSYSGEAEDDWEGCLSVPDKRGLVTRAKSIEVRYQDAKQDWHRASFQGFVARVFQHELDHLDGICFVDRNPKRVLSLSQWQEEYGS